MLSASPSMQKPARKNRKTKAHPTAWTRTSISTPSLIPPAGKENDPGTHCHHRGPGDGPRRARRERKTLVHVQRTVARRCRRLSTFDFHAAALAEHGHTKIDPFLWGLLPDNEKVLDNWARKFHISARNAFAPIANVG